MAELNRLRVLEPTVASGALTADDVAALAASYLGAPLDARRRRTPARAQSEGNPFFAEELLRGWLERARWPSAAGRLGAVRSRRRSRCRSRPASSRPCASGSARLAPEVVDAPARRRRRRARVRRRAARRGGRPDRSEVDERRRAAAERARLVRASSARRVPFSHDKIRECLYAGADAARRRRLHGTDRPRDRRTGRARAGARQLADLAFHFARSGDRARGATYAGSAAEQAMRAYAPAEAPTHYRAALALLGDDDRGAASCRSRSARRRSWPAREREAVAAFEAAQAWFARAGEPAAAGRAAPPAGEAWWRQEAIAEARAAFEEARRCWTTEPGPRRWSRRWSTWAACSAVSLHEQAAGIAHARRALALAERSGTTPAARRGHPRARQPAGARQRLAAGVAAARAGARARDRGRRSGRGGRVLRLPGAGLLLAGRARALPAR